MTEIIACFYAERNNPEDGLTLTMRDREGREAGAMSLARLGGRGSIKYRRKGMAFEWSIDGASTAIDGKKK